MKGSFPKLLDVGREGAPKTVGELPMKIDVDGTIRREVLNLLAPVDVSRVLRAAHIGAELRPRRHGCWLITPTPHQLRSFHHLISANDQIEIQALTEREAAINRHGQRRSLESKNGNPFALKH